ncbi:MAG: purine-nucleoside phosphorylase [Deltaproteobacteria bacterium]|nr:purine-nucleoside phosphorylase [Deltaproteobacteria bacterium]
MSRKADLHTRLEYARAWVRGRTELRPFIGLVLGSGMGALAGRFEGAVSIAYEQIPEFAAASVAGHAGQLVVGTLGGVPVAAMQGRVHAYEGWSAEEVTFGVRLLAATGVRALLLTNAAGAVNPSFAAGQLVRITDHLNLTGLNPLTGPNDDRIGPRFLDMTEPYDPRLGALLDASAARLGIPLGAGVYAGLAGPSYETPAEVRMLRTLGADLVGMSTVLEVIAARHAGLRVSAISLVTNLAAGLAGKPLSHADVLAAGESALDRIALLATAWVAEAAG